MEVQLVQGEELEFEEVREESPILQDEDIDSKYRKGDTRIVTEQARYPLPSLAKIIESDFDLQPDFQRRHRWDNIKRSKLIESIIMNVPIPPIFLYEDSYGHYEVMDGLQRLTAIHQFYNNEFALENLEEWQELNGRRYSELPPLVAKGIDRRHLSAIILLSETAKSAEEARRLKQLVFERLNSGGVKLSPQESRNAIYDGPMNQLCFKLSRDRNFCKLWGIPEPNEEEWQTKQISQEALDNSLVINMQDAEFVLRFFANRQKAHRLKLTEKHDRKQERFFDNYLVQANLYSETTLNELKDLFELVMNTTLEVFGENALLLFRENKKGWYWRNKPAVTVYDALCYAVSVFIDSRDILLACKEALRDGLEDFYKENHDIFQGRKVNQADVVKREQAFCEYIKQVAGLC